MNIDIMPWIDLAVRWLHVIAGIAWIGSSFYFVWLDDHLVKGKDMPDGVSGELWAVHGGGFYHNQKYLVAPAKMPAELHWFKYEAYFTWISGLLLLCIVYYYDASIFLIDSSKLTLTPLQAVGIGLTFIAGGWIVYDALCRSRIGDNAPLFGGLWFLVLLGSAYALTHIFSGRGAFIHVGAMIGTAMAANVFFVIIPNQKKVVATMLAGNTPDPRLGKKAKQRSLHNNYMTLPVLLIMVSNHYPMLFGSNANWIVLAALSLAGVMVRHFFNLRHRGKFVWELPAAAAAVFIGTMFFAADVEHRSEPAAVSHARVPFAAVRAIVDRNCVSCHSAAPVHVGILSPPAGLDFTKDEVLEKNASRIRVRTVTTQTMPLGNETHMTAAERATLGAWIDQGAHGEAGR